MTREEMHFGLPALTLALIALLAVFIVGDRSCERDHIELMQTLENCNAIGGTVTRSGTYGVYCVPPFERETPHAVE